MLPFSLSVCVKQRRRDSEETILLEDARRRGVLWEGRRELRLEEAAGLLSLCLLPWVHSLIYQSCRMEIYITLSFDLQYHIRFEKAVSTNHTPIHALYIGARF